MSTKLDEFTDAYDENYVLDNRLMLNWYPERVASLARHGSMLELGLGHGYSTAHFARTFRRYVIVEGSQHIIDRYRSRFPTAEVDMVLALFEDFDTAERFDAICLGFVLEHVNDPALILRRFARYLAPSGSMFIAVPNAESLHRRFGHAAGMLPDMTALSQSDIDFGHQRYFTLDSLRRLVESEGISIQHVEGLLLKPITTQQMIDLELSEATLQAMLKVGVNYPELCNAILMQAGNA